jgi:hypothetical protein
MGVSVDSKVQDALTTLATDCERAANETFGYVGSGANRWFMPPLDGWSGNPLDIAGIRLAFQRSTPNANAIGQLNGGTIGRSAGEGLQIAYMGTRERSFRLRHMTPVRAAMHAAGRRKAHSNENGLHVGSVLNYLQNMLNSDST